MAIKKPANTDELQQWKC